MDTYIKLKDIFDSTPLKKVGEYWPESWGEYRRLLIKLRKALNENRLEEEINQLTLIQLKRIHNCATMDNDLLLAYRDSTFVAKRDDETVEIFNAIIDRIEAISNNVVHIHS